ncbi:MAG: GNAT family N-acetyltransferase [Burkholderiales bacterium]
MSAACSIRLASWQEVRAAVAPVREAVFLREQGVPEDLEWDEHDATALHAVALGPLGRAIGTARLLADGQIGRMAVLASWRGRGVGSAMLEMLLAAARERGLRDVRLNAQVQAIAFYERHGFTAGGSEFLDAGIPHVAMHRQVGSTS